MGDAKQKNASLVYFGSYTTRLDNCLVQMNYNRPKNQFFFRILGTCRIFYFSDWMVDIWCGPLLYFWIVHNPFLVQTDALDKSIISEMERSITPSQDKWTWSMNPHAPRKTKFFLLQPGLEPAPLGLLPNALSTIL